MTRLFQVGRLMPPILSRDELDLLRRLVRMEIRKRERGLAKARPHGMQTRQEFEVFCESIRSKILFEENLLRRLTLLRKTTR